MLPVPGGSDTVNQTYYTTEKDLLDRLQSMEIGMPKEEVFGRLGRKEDELTKLQRYETIQALYGSSNVEFVNGTTENNSQFLQSLYGYKLNYKIVGRKHGFSSPIRIRTDEKGFDYTIIFVFREQQLFERPIISGGVVNQSSSGTVFDYLTPGTILKHVGAD